MFPRTAIFSSSIASLQGKTPLVFECFPYVCPEPVWTK
jgi:hypothetical protein